MDTPTKQKIIDLRNEGVGYKRIADQLESQIGSRGSRGDPNQEIGNGLSAVKDDGRLFAF